MKDRAILDPDFIAVHERAHGSCAHFVNDPSMERALLPIDTWEKNRPFDNPLKLG